MEKRKQIISKFRCRWCGKKADVNLRTYKISLCKQCYIKFFENLVIRDIKKYKIIKQNEKILVALSGGKDSITTLYILNKIKKAYNNYIEALHINLGIAGFSEKSLEIAKKISQSLGVQLNIIYLKDYGYVIDDVDPRTKCSVCGTVKRYLINKFAREHGFDVIATGHNADDIAINILKNMISSNFEWSQKLLPRTMGYDAFVSRIRPLFLRTEVEITYYLDFLGIDYIREPCPYTHHNKWKDALNAIESHITGFKQNLVRNYTKYYLMSANNINEQERNKVKHCAICNEPSNKNICQFCRYRQKYSKHER